MSIKHRWSDYQKEIADDNYYYVRSCIRQNFFPGSEAAFLKIIGGDLGRTILDDPRHTSCTGIGYHSDIVPLETLMTVVARQFSTMADSGLENLAISCITSFGIYSEVLETWQHFPETEEQTRRYLLEATGREFKKPKNIAHTSDIIFHHREEIARKAKLRLVNHETGEPLQVVDHIGCHYHKLFPEKSSLGGGEFPCVLSGMVAAWGGHIVDYPERRHCCGFGFRNYLVMANRGYSVSNSKKKLESMAPYKPDFIVANCPGCAMFLDRWQYAISEMEGITYGAQGGIPVLTYEEMAGLVLGYDPWELGMQMHQVPVESLLDKMGVEYDPSQKYLGKNGKYIGRPAETSLDGCGSI